MDGGIDWIRDEMAANSGDEMVQMIGEHLTAYVQRYPDARFRAGATIKSAQKAMMSEARKHAVGNMAALSFTAGMQIVYEHMGLNWDKRACMELQMSMYDAAAPLPAAAREETQAHADELDLDMLLGG